MEQIEQKLSKLAWLQPKTAPELATALGIGTAGFDEFMLLLDRLVQSKQLDRKYIGSGGIVLPAYQWADRPTLMPY